MLVCVCISGTFETSHAVVCEWEAEQLWEGLRGVEEVWHCSLVSCLSVQVLKVLSSKSTVRELSLEDL